jgi:predicted TIM-barrel fold metal-dependent hydrolase
MGTPGAVIDADGHVVEDDRTLLEYLPPPFRGRPELLGMPFFPTLDGWHRSARRVADGQGRLLEIPTAEDWLDFLDEARVAWTVLYPTAGLAFGLIPDPEWAAVLARGYNDWLHDRFVRVSPRLKGMALIPLQDPVAAAAELRRAVGELGMVGAVLPAVGLRDPFGDRGYWPVYAAAQELDTLLTVHAGATQGLGLAHLRRFIEVRTLSHGVGQMVQMTSMMFGGVFDAFPRLRIAFAEAGCGWVPYLAERLDMEYSHRTTQAPGLAQTPSEHLRGGRIFVHCELEERGLPQAAACLGEAALFAASDYPHEPKGEFPEAVASFRARTDISDSLKRRILQENPRRMYAQSE